MARVSKETLKSYFELGDVPTQNEFADLIDSLALQEDLETLEEEAGDQASDINDLEGMIHAVVTNLGGSIRRVDVGMIDGYYLSNAASPSLVANNNYQITRPIQLSAGETVVLRCNQGGVSAIALTNASASVFTRVVSGSSSKKIYTYTATENTYVSLCGQKSLFQFAVITLNVFEKITQLEKRVADVEEIVKRLSL